MPPPPPLLGQDVPVRDIGEVPPPPPPRTQELSFQEELALKLKYGKNYKEHLPQVAEKKEADIRNEERLA